MSTIPHTADMLDLFVHNWIVEHESFIPNQTTSVDHAFPHRIVVCANAEDANELIHRVRHRGWCARQDVRKPKVHGVRCWFYIVSIEAPTEKP